ncbi:MAG: S-methyl-5-thioribose-1-phosphate isomerase [Candidatus Cloacimonetes bacterium]|nr:S-methyl-5-thioribose-1-phosphate isomerase [Candidatus Cloacimonadota bacterium]
MKMNIRSLEFKNNKLFLIDQRVLPQQYKKFICRNFKDVEFAITDMVVRGAPAIGVTAAYGIVLAAIEFIDLPPKDFFKKMHLACDLINKSRPTAVNLMWAITRMSKLLIESKTQKEILSDLRKEANIIADEDIQTNKKMGQLGNSLIPQKATILTHCNTGALATVKYGTALGVIRAAVASGKDIFVYADETRPRLQGSRLTAWELVQEGIPAKLIADSVAATLIRDGKIDLILVGADRIATNGDTANKIGTFMLSVMARVYRIPFYIVAPTTTIDFSRQTGTEIEIEERSPREVTHIMNVQIAPDNIDIYNPAFDVTPNENITAIITEKGIIEKPFKENILKLK